MINVNIRVLTEKKNYLFGDYTEHIGLIKSQGKEEIRVNINDRGDCLEIYQYYSTCPLFLMEVKMLRRLGVGASICYMKSSLTDTLHRLHIPKLWKRIYKAYLKWFISEMDCVVVADEKIRKELQEEGVCEPGYYYIPESGVFADPVKFCIWKEIYKHFMSRLPEYEKMQMNGQEQNTICL